MNNNLTYRLFEQEDIEGILRLWNDDSGWGGITERQFDDWFVNTPHGKCLITVAVDENNQIVGQELLTPARIHIDGAEKKALRLSAPILAKEFRVRMVSGAHPIAEMYRAGINAAIENGYSVVYSFPAAIYLPALRFFSPPCGLKPNQFAAATFDCHALSSKSFSTENLADNEVVEVSLATEFNEEYDRLWQSAKNEFPINCAIVRSSSWLKWKLGSHCVLEVRGRDSKELIGYTAIKKHTGLLVDALARTPQDLEITIMAAIKALCQCEELRNHMNVGRIKVMRTETLASVIQKLGFECEKFKFAFWCCSIDETISTEALEPSRWYMMPND